MSDFSGINVDKASLMLSIDEGDRDRPYDDATGEEISAPKGNVTIGVGHNTDANPLSTAVRRLILYEDIEIALRSCRQLLGTTWDGLSEHRRLGILNLMFNLGYSRLSRFPLFLAAVKKGNWSEAEVQLRNSLWAAQVDPRKIPGQGRDDRVIALICRDEYAYAFKTITH